ncbi:MAG: chemotaxis protein CheB, partial [Limisphaerales bacterium]
VGVVLTGYLDDWTAGLAAIKLNGGISVVQDPSEAEAPGMPQSALRYVEVDYCLRLAEMGPLLVRLAGERTIPEDMKPKKPAKERLMSPEEMTGKFGAPTAFVCPDCNGALWETPIGRALQFRCHVGHRYSPETLLTEQTEGLEDALWSVVRTLDEQAALLRRLARRQSEPADDQADLENRARHCQEQAAAIRARFRKL